MSPPKICGPKADKLFSRGFGRRDGKCIILSWEEALYLSEKSLISENFLSLLSQGSKEITNLDVRYLTYQDLRDRGYVLEVKNTHFKGRKNYSMCFYPISDLDFFQPNEFLKREMPFILAVVDGDGDITYYMVDLVEPTGEFCKFPQERVRGYNYGQRYFVIEPRKLKDTTFGKSEGLFAHLSIFEAAYLMEKGYLQGNAIENILQNPVYLGYRDLRERGLIVKSGFKYGTHFRVYGKSMEEHSKYLVHVISSHEEMQKVSRAARVAHGVRKTLLLAYAKNKKINYFKVAWIKP